MDEVTTQFAIAYATAGILEWLKKRPWFPLMNADSAQLNRFTGLAASFLTSIGVHLLSSWQADTGTLTITLSGLTIQNFAHGIITWVKQGAFQQVCYKGLVRNGKQTQDPKQIKGESGDNAQKHIETS